MLRLRGARSGDLIHLIGRLFLEGTSIGSSEGELLDRFVKARDESAFEALVARHGPMVLGVCRQLLRDPNDVDDAFQATFLVLVRKAATLRQCDLLGNWLYGVAIRVAMRARSQAARRMGRFGSQGAIEKLAAAEELQGPDSSSATSIEFEQRPLLHQEVSHLPEKYRTPIVLCYFEGLTHDEAASRLGCPLGTVKGRLARARDLLRRRLTRRGVALSAAALASQLAAPHAQAAVPAALEMATTRSAISLVSSAGASLFCGSSISLPVTALAEGVFNTMMWNQVRITAASFVLAGTLATGVVVGATKFAADAGDGGEPQAAGQGSKAAAAQGGAPAAKPAGSASAKPAQSISPDLQSQLSATNKTFDRMLSRERNLSIADIDRMSTWSNLMLSADLVLATSDEDRTAARTAHRDRMKKLHEAIKALPASAQNQTVNAQHAQEKLEEAESLLQSGADQGPGSGMMGMMQNQMQRMSSLGGPGGGRGGRGMMGGMMGGRGGMGGMMMGGATKKGRVVVHSASEAGGESAGGAGIGSGSRAAGSGGEFRPASEGGAASSGTGAQAGAMSQPAGGMTSMTGPGGTGGAMMSPSGGMGGPGGVGARHLSIALVTTATELAIRDKNPRSTAVRKKLDEPIPMSFNEETPLEEIVKYIKQATTTEKYQGIPIYIDPQGLQDAETTMASTVKFMELEGIPLKTTLRLLLKQLGLAYCVRDGVLIISSPQGIFAELREAQQELDTAKEIEEGADPEPSPE